MADATTAYDFYRDRADRARSPFLAVQEAASHVVGWHRAMSQPDSDGWINSNA